MQQIKNKKNFEYIFYNILIVLLIVLSIFFFISALILNQDYFLKFSPDKHLDITTIKKIEFLRFSLLLISTIFLFFILLLAYFKESSINYIKKHKNFIQKISLLIIVIALLFVILEISLKIALNEQTLGGGFGPGSLKFNEKYVHLNKENMRDKDYTIAKPGNTIRIAAIGDSFTFGSGIKNVNDTYSELLEKKLNEIFEKNYEVLNFGTPGKNTEAEISILKDRALKYSPDIVIISYTWNDLKNIDKNAKEYRYFTILPYLGFWLRNLIYTYPYIELKTNYLLDSLGIKETVIESTKNIYNSKINQEYNKKLFEELKTLSKENKFEIVVIIFPGLVNFKDYPYNDLHKLIRETSEENGFYVVDLYNAYSKYNANKLIVSKYDTHPNELGHRLAADELLEKLINISVIK